MLDQLTDRCATLGLLMVLASFYPRWMLFFQLFAVVDVASHWLHLHSCDLVKAATHKQSTNPLLHLYYTSNKFLFFMCLGNEAFLCFLYVCHFSTGPTLPLPWLPVAGLYQFGAAVCFPLAMTKSAISLVHLATAAQTVAQLDQDEKNNK